MKLLRLLIAFGCGFTACFCWQMFRDCGVEPQVKQTIPFIEEIQMLVGCEKIDGKLSPDWRESETQRKWDEAIIKQCAAEWNHLYE